MKTSIKLLFVAAMISLFASCAKNPAKLLVKKDGTWTAISVTTVPGWGTFTDTAEITFADGTGTSKDNAGVSSPFTWSYDKKDANLTSTMVDGTNTTITISHVTDIKKDSETWTFVSGTENGVAFTTADFTQVTKVTRK